MGRILVMGDIHGAHKALVQCLERSKFDNEKDTLIQLGDIVDGWSEVFECVEELLKIKNLIAIKGNHDDWFNTWLETGNHTVYWLQGGNGTLDSYCKALNKESVPRMGGYTTNLLVKDVPISHLELFKNQKLLFRDHQNRCFVHGGFDKEQYMDYLIQFFPEDFYWNRDLWNKALSCHNGKLKFVEEFKEVFIGHTTTINWDRSAKPMNSGGVWNLDQGAGWYGKLTIMDVDSKEYWQSDMVQELYPGIRGRN